METKDPFEDINSISDRYTSQSSEQIIFKILLMCFCYNLKLT